MSGTQDIRKYANILNESVETLEESSAGVITVEFSEEQVMTIMQSVNNMLTSDDPITIEEIRSSEKLRAYLAEEFKSIVDMGVDGADDAIGEYDWLTDINDYRDSADEGEIGFPGAENDIDLSDAGDDPRFSTPGSSY